VPDDTELMEEAAIVFVLLEAELIDDVGAAVLVLRAEVELVEDACGLGYVSSGNASDIGEHIALVDALAAMARETTGPRLGIGGSLFA
jgi:hypothetical protein